MNTIIIYGSKYGATKKYAVELSHIIKSEVISYKEVKSVFFYDQIIYLGGIYAGSILGLSKTLKLLPANGTQNIIIATVSLADPSDEKNSSHIKASLQKQIPKTIYDKSNIFHLRGGIDYSKLTFIHKIMMNFLYNKVKKIPIEKQTREDKDLIETYNKKVDFVNLDSLNQIVETVLSTI